MISINSWNTFIDRFITQKGYLLTLEGLKNTAIIAVLGLIIGFIIGSIITIVKLIPSKKVFAKFIRILCDGYIVVLRGTPLLVQLLLCHFALFPFNILSSVSPRGYDACAPVPLCCPLLRRLYGTPAPDRYNRLGKLSQNQAFLWLFPFLCLTRIRTRRSFVHLFT